jgi:hypothetical protein
MARYFFHMGTKDKQIFDETGRECASLYAAYEHAQTLVHNIESFMPEQEMKGWTLKVCTSNGNTELVVLFPYRTPKWMVWN